MQNTNLLNDVEKIEKIDKKGLLKDYVKFLDHCKEAIRIAEKIEIPKVVHVSKKITLEYGTPIGVIFAGVGGSVIGGEILKDWLEYRAPVSMEICRNYRLPAHVKENMLVFVNSYSGNTEEAVSLLLNSVKRRCMTIALTSGGYLRLFSEKLHIPCVKVPTGLLPRSAFPYLFFSFPILMEKLGISLNVMLDEEIDEALRVLEGLSVKTAPEVPVENNPSKKIALELGDSIPVIFGFKQYASISYRLKTQFNESSKVPCYHCVFPELKHNEVVGWEGPETFTKLFSIIFLRDQYEPPEVKYQIELVKKLVENKVKSTLEIRSIGERDLARMLSLMYIGELASIYLAILRGIDPSTVHSITKIKNEMQKKFKIFMQIEKELRNLAN